MKYKSIKEIETELKKVVEGFKFDEYDLNPITERIKKQFIRESIIKYNLLNIKNHNLKDESNHYKDRLSFNSLLYDKEFNFNKIEDRIKEEFKQYTKEDRIKETMFYLYLEKVFNQENKKYFSLWDFKKEKTQEQIKTEVETRINNLKEIPLSWNSDKYYIKEYLENLKELLKLLFDIDINFNYEYQNKDFKVYENEINNSNNKIKLKCFTSWFYISFTDKKQESTFKNLLINQMLKRIGD